MNKRKKIAKGGLLEFFRIRFYRAHGFFPFTKNGVAYKGDPYHLNFWRNFSAGYWEPDTFKVLGEYLSPGSVVCDIGAWIGPTVLYAASRCSKVFCFEPDNVAYHYLLWNLRLNQLDNVLPFNIALASEDGLQKISSFGSRLGDTRSSLLNPKQEDQVDVLCLTWDSWQRFASPGRVDFIKMDIEGGEFSLLPSMKDYLAEEKPTLYLSTHAMFLPENQSQAGMKGLRSILEDVYSVCLNDRLERISMDALEKPDALAKPMAFVFTS